MGTHLSGPFKSQQINNVSFLKGVMSELNLGGWQGGGADHRQSIGQYNKLYRAYLIPIGYINNDKTYTPYIECCQCQFYMLW